MHTCSATHHLATPLLCRSEELRAGPFPVASAYLRVWPWPLEFFRPQQSNGSSTDHAQYLKGENARPKLHRIDSTADGALLELEVPASTKSTSETGARLSRMITTVTCAACFLPGLIAWVCNQLACLLFRKLTQASHMPSLIIQTTGAAHIPHQCSRLHVSASSSRKESHDNSLNSPTRNWCPSTSLRKPSRVLTGLQNGRTNLINPWNIRASVPPSASASPPRAAKLENALTEFQCVLIAETFLFMIVGECM